MVFLALSQHKLLLEGDHAKLRDEKTKSKTFNLFLETDCLQILVGPITLKFETS